ncbi:hypothetical protein ABT369_39245 [Dactylosporangium sp. NPDC000244]|uniref:hypothetical protein n=1 Tax=Dactylosporangium sp. NPDC000244 TaxID=3154365 RepID=UPI003318415B
MSDNRPSRCPTCELPQPSMHPASSGGGEVVRLCPDEFHVDDRAYMPENPRCPHCGSQAVAAVAGVQSCNACGMTSGVR